MSTRADDAATPQASVRRIDPHRRDRIIDACLTVIADAGVSGTTHRRVAAVADVPLGSMTYHFAGMDDLLQAAFTRFAGTVADRFDDRMRTVTSAADVSNAVVRLILDDVFAEQRDLVLTLELYTIASRRPEFRTITDAWMSRSRTALETLVAPETARQLDALIEGLTIHQALGTAPLSTELVADAVRRIVGNATA